MSLYHVNRGRNIKPEEIENSEMFQQLEKRAHPKSWAAAIKIADRVIDEMDAQQKDWAQLASLFGHKGSAVIKDADLVWRMIEKSAKGHGVLTKKMFGVFLMWRFASRDGWCAYVKETGNYDEISEKEITVTCYFRKS